MTDSTAPLVRDLMTPDVFTVDRNEALLTADRVMHLGRIRHVVVVDENGAVCGVLSQRDLFHNALLKALGFGTFAAQKAMDSLVVKEVMTSSVVTVSSVTALETAASTMVTRKIGCLPVVDDGKLVGILTESDFVKLHAKP